MRGWQLKLNSVGSPETDRVHWCAESCAGAGEGADVRGLPAAGGDESSACAGLEGGGGPGDHQGAAQDRRLPGRGLDARTSRRCWRRWTRAALVTSTRGWCADWTTTRDHLRVHRADGSGLGTQNALLGGGRYDGLSEMLGGPKAPGIGFAIGEDRLILTLQEQAGAKA